MTDADVLPTLVSPLLGRSGAVPGSGVEAGVAVHYGDPMREQRALAQGAAVVDLSHRGVVTVTGPDRSSWLNSFTTQNLLDAAPGVGAETLLLSPKGHVENALHLVDDGESAWITVEPGTASALVAFLERMKFMLRVEVADRTAEVAVLGEPSAAAGVEGGPVTWVDPWPGPVGDTALYGPEEHPANGRAWREVLVPRGDLDAAVGDRPLAGLWAAEAERIQAWRPRFGADTDHRTIPHELDWLRTAVHLHKGCYRGQETIARVHNLGRPPRRFVFCHLDGSEHVLPVAGTELVHGGRVVGRLTSVARHHEDGPIALAVIKRSTPVDAVLETVPAPGEAAITVAQTVIVEP